MRNLYRPYVHYIFLSLIIYGHKFIYFIGHSPAFLYLKSVLFYPYFMFLSLIIYGHYVYLFYWTSVFFTWYKDGHDG